MSAYDTPQGGAHVELTVIPPLKEWAFSFGSSVKRPFISSKNAQDFLKVIELHSELEKEKNNIYQKLDDKEKHEVFEIIRKIYNIPRHLTVKDVAEIMGITPQMVRRYCTGGSCPPNKR